ncbi:hypothetical protein O1611_g87 [Lasiodiplodia mahajangana]|uniref:Uncharacterized protein n=1 Tax=Lasiodiplodia mahajangana TaxID=1108764 RepID=A0ACC2K1H7_9PEZI|nr:hypothetical protein O1611_g87 [Lasiodiplodia mahajangana]
MSFLTYPLLRFAAFVLRILARLQGRITSSPDDTFYLESRDKGRAIQIHIYKSSHSSGPCPVLLNLHGSGFVIPGHGSDDRFCRLVSQSTPYTVLDIRYRLAPESPFPAALNDLEDVVKWVLRQPTRYDLSRVAISGFSAGATLALAAASCLFPASTFRHLVAFYPLVDFTDLDTKRPPDPSGNPIPIFVLRLFKWCYLQSGEDARDPRISPIFAQPESFPTSTMTVTAARDCLALEGEALEAKLQKQLTGRHVSLRMDSCDHAWDKTALDNTPEADARDKAYKQVLQLLLE